MRRFGPARIAAVFAFWGLLLPGCPSKKADERPQPTPAAKSQPSSQPASAPSAPFPLELATTSSISADDLRAEVGFLASDALEGRGAGTKGLAKAAAYIEKRFKAAGLSPVFGGSYRQPFDVAVASKLGKSNRLEKNGHRFQLLKDFAPFSFSNNGRAKGQVVFAGYGIRAEKEHHYDDYEDLDVKEKIVVVLSGEPGEDDPKSPFDGKKTTRYSALRLKTLAAREAGARAILVVRKRIKYAGDHAPESEAGIIAAGITQETASTLLGFDVAEAQRKIDTTYEPASKMGKTNGVSLEVSVVRIEKTVENVAGLLIPKTATSTEVVVIGAHYDHLGYGGEASLSGTDERIVHNGADDNASGTSAVIEAAKALAKNPEGLKRRVLFICFAGEELGLLGSAAFVKATPIDKHAMVAMVNLDMVGRLRENKLNVMGTNSGLELESLAQQVVKLHGLSATYGGDAYGPSDHTSFYAAGVPVLFLFTGAHENYHKPSDDPDTLNYPGLARVAAAAADIVRGLASATIRPTYVEMPAPPPSSGRGYGPYFGSIPEFGDQIDGVKLSGVRKDSPADKAGVRKGDVIVEFGGIGVKNLQDFTQALRECAPGDVVKVKVRRGEKVLEVQATLKKRGED